MSRSFMVCVLLVSKPANFTTFGDAQNIPFEPTVSYWFFLAIGLLLSVLFSQEFASTIQFGFERRVLKH